MIKSKTKIELQLEKKTNPVLVQTVVSAKKNPAWIEVAALLTSPGSQRKGVNLSDIERTEGEVIVVCGKVLSQGEITKKVRVVALRFSENAKKKLKEAGCEMITIMEEIKNNKDAKGVVILK
ncbi:MAG: 50S ribosomal protein L18e [Nanoarchaeota archaeon]|jgi:large subunit ribosomal protein L18e|nr:50S ribosomal protein L18e [Nanoarchaeota archaeon]